MTHNTDLQSDPIPATIRGFLTAHVVRDADTALLFFAEDAVVVEHRPGAVSNLSTALRGLTEPAVPAMF